MTSEHIFLNRCIELAEKGAGSVAPNPMVGAVLVHDDRIIGEGWHRQYGEAHAEVNCLHSVRETELIPGSTLFVSLEPCAHTGKTPACTDLIVRYRVPKVVIGCVDPFEKVNGKGIEKLRSAGVEVELAEGEIAQACCDLNKRFFTFHRERRPYIILKWAQTADGFIAGAAPQTVHAGVQTPRALISNDYTNRLVHKWRSEESAILVGTQTAMLDDPELTTRYWPGSSPLRLVMDMDLQLPDNLKLFKGQPSTIVFNKHKHDVPGGISCVELRAASRLFYYKLDGSPYTVRRMADAAYFLGIQSVLVEGGRRLLQSFIDEEMWDEARIIRNTGLYLEQGLKGPDLGSALPAGSTKIASDQIDCYRQERLESE